MNENKYFYCFGGKFLFKIVFVSGLLIFTFGLSRTSAQEVLSAQEAVKIGIEQNFSVRILRNQEQVASNNNTAGNAGMLPTVSTIGTTSYSVN
ncbi:MAG: hypothetical protein ACKPFK_16525, partial [Dolichospermum sp.]